MFLMKSNVGYAGWIRNTPRSEIDAQSIRPKTYIWVAGCTRYVLAIPGLTRSAPCYIACIRMYSIRHTRAETTKSRKNKQARMSGKDPGVPDAAVGDRTTAGALPAMTSNALTAIPEDS